MREHNGAVPASCLEVVERSIEWRHLRRLNCPRTRSQERKLFEPTVGAIKATYRDFLQGNPQLIDLVFRKACVAKPGGLPVEVDGQTRRDNVELDLVVQGRPLGKVGEIVLYETRRE